MLLFRSELAEQCNEMLDCFQRYLQEAKIKSLRQPKLSDMSAQGMVQTNWKFVETLLKECKTKVLLSMFKEKKKIFFFSMLPVI